MYAGESLTLLIFSRHLERHQQNAPLKPFWRLWGWSYCCASILALLFLTTLQNSYSHAFSKTAGTSFVQGGVAEGKIRLIPSPTGKEEHRGGCAACMFGL